MNTETLPVSPQSGTVDPIPFTLHQILRYSSMGELQNHDASDLLSMKQLLKAKVEEVQRTLKTTNVFKSVARELQGDVNWYVYVETEIDALLTAAFHRR